MVTSFRSALVHSELEAHLRYETLSKNIFEFQFIFVKIVLGIEFVYTYFYL